MLYQAVACGMIYIHHIYVPITLHMILVAAAPYHWHHNVTVVLAVWHVLSLVSQSDCGSSCVARAVAGVTV